MLDHAYYQQLAIQSLVHFDHSMHFAHGHLA